MKKVTFNKEYVGQMRACAEFVAGLVSSGVEFNIIDDLNTITIEITGGY